MNNHKLFGLVFRSYCDTPMRNLITFPIAEIQEGKSKYMMAYVYIHGEMGNAKIVIRSNARAKYHRKLRKSMKPMILMIDFLTPPYSRRLRRFTKGGIEEGLVHSRTWRWLYDPRHGKEVHEALWPVPDPGQGRSRECP